MSDQCQSLQVFLKVGKGLKCAIEQKEITSQLERIMKGEWPNFTFEVFVQRDCEDTTHHGEEIVAMEVKLPCAKLVYGSVLKGIYSKLGPYLTSLLGENSIHGEVMDPVKIVPEENMDTDSK